MIKILLWLKWALFVMFSSPIYIIFAFIHLIGYVLIKADIVCNKMIAISVKLKRKFNEAS